MLVRGRGRLVQAWAAGVHAAALAAELQPSGPGCVQTAHLQVATAPCGALEGQAAVEEGVGGHALAGRTGDGGQLEEVARQDELQAAPGGVQPADLPR